MTVGETTQFLNIMKAAYPSFKVEDMEGAITVWAAMFKNESYKTVTNALYVFLHGENEYAPTPGQLKGIIFRETHRGDLSEIDAWNLVAKALRNGTYGAEEEYKALPEPVQRAIGSPNYLRNLALSENLNISVESSNFFKRYRQIMDQEKEQAMIPRKVLDLISMNG